MAPVISAPKVVLQPCAERRRDACVLLECGLLTVSGFAVRKWSFEGRFSERCKG